MALSSQQLIVSLLLLSLASFASTLPAHEKSSQKPLPTVGSTCASLPSDSPHRGFGGTYTQKCIYPDGTTWVCNANATLCKRKTRVIGNKNKRPALPDKPQVVAPTNKQPPKATKRVPGNQLNFDEADSLFGKRTN